jgi:hypothetical protein
MATCSITDDIIIDNPEAIERLVELLEEGENELIYMSKEEKRNCLNI